jgi:hypothetical protein
LAGRSARRRQPKPLTFEDLFSVHHERLYRALSMIVDRTERSESAAQDEHWEQACLIGLPTRLHGEPAVLRLSVARRINVPCGLCG